MSYKKEPLIKSITDNLAFSSKSTTLRNVIGLFDSNRIAQEFFAELFSLIFEFNDLQELDKLNDIVNYPAIDLGDEVKKVAFQITTQSDSTKIKDTISKFLTHNLYEKYDRLIFFVIGQKQTSYSAKFDTKGKFTFDIEKDIWDDSTLVKKIDKLKVDKLEKIHAFLEKNLVEFKLPARLFDSDIKNCIEILKRDFGSCQKIRDIVNRNDNDFINRKNKLNKLSWDFFKNKIRGHLQYNETIEKFLQNPINKISQEDYLNVASAIQNYYLSERDNFSTFEIVFKEVFQKINTYEDEGQGLDSKIKILLHNMYFNCDIGDNPASND